MEMRISSFSNKIKDFRGLLKIYKRHLLDLIKLIKAIIKIKFSFKIIIKAIKIISD
jgi:hypothetical protein